MEMDTNDEIKSKRDMFKGRLSKKYPNSNFDDEETLYGQISDDYDNYDKEISGYKEREGKFADMFSSDPRSATFLQNWKNGSDPSIELVRQFGTDIKDAIDDPEKLDQIAEANKEYLARVAETKKLDEEYKSNLQASLSQLEEYQQKNGLSDEQVDNAMEFVMRIVKDGVMGKFSAETLDMAMKAINHDNDVANANLEGEVRGKNTKVEETLRKPSQGDGVPNLDGKNGSARQQKKRNDIFSLASEAR